MAKRGEYSIEDLNKLIKAIQEATSLDENEIEAEISRSYGYLAQTRSRGKVPTALYNLLQNTFKDRLQNTSHRNGAVNTNGNGNHAAPIDEIIRSKDQTIEALKDQIGFLKGENQRLQGQCENSLTKLMHYAQLNHSRLKLIVECQKLLRAVAIREKIDPKTLKVASEDLDKIFESILVDTIQSDKD